jgi:hypothetical protein
MPLIVAGVGDAALDPVRILTKRFWHGCTWGLVSTLVMTVILVIAWRIWPGGVAQPLPLAVSVGIVAQTFQVDSLATGTLVAGLAMELFYGAIWGGLFETGTERVTVGKGIWLGLGLWLLMIVFYLPMSGLPVFELATSPGMWISTLAGHVIYGATLGALLERDQHRLPLPPEESEVFVG